MSDERITASVALFFRQDNGASVPVDWLDSARKVFVDYGLSPILFTGFGGNFLYDDCYVLDARGGGLELWGERLPAREKELRDALADGQIEDLRLDSPRLGAANREDWRADVSVSTKSGEIFIGVDDALADDLLILTCRAITIAKHFFAVRYGFAYKMPLSEYPASYAAGHSRTTYSELLEMIQNRRDWDKRPQTADKLWSDEIYGQRGYLKGLFRGAYPASVLSEVHVRTADLEAHPIGKLSQLDSSLWLWELSDTEASAAQEMLHDKRLLVSQAGE